MSSLSERENKRKQSVVGAMIADRPEKPEDEEVKTSQNNIEIVLKPKAEIRSKRVNFVITPSLYEKANRKCQEMGVSLNECINQLLEAWTQNS